MAEPISLTTIGSAIAVKFGATAFERFIEKVQDETGTEISKDSSIAEEVRKQLKSGNNEKAAELIVSETELTKREIANAINAKDVAKNNI